MHILWLYISCNVCFNLICHFKLGTIYMKGYQSRNNSYYLIKIYMGVTNFMPGFISLSKLCLQKLV